MTSTVFHKQDKTFENKAKANHATTKHYKIKVGIIR